MDDTITISREGFIYKDGQIYAEIEGKYYPRESADSLYIILTNALSTPEMKTTKSGEVAKRQPKDTHSAQFYTAQLIHYGLKPLKTRDPARKKLLASYTTSGVDTRTLEVPPALTLLEEAMAREWRDEIKKQSKGKRKSEEALVSSPNAVEKGPAPVPAKRPRTIQTARKTTGGAAYATAGNSTSIVSNSNAVEQNPGAPAPAKRPWTKQTARKSTGGGAGSSMNMGTKPQPAAAIPEAQRTKQTAVKTAPYDDGVGDLNIRSSSPESRPRTKQRAPMGRGPPGILNIVVVRRDELKKKIKEKKAAEVQKSNDELKLEIESLSAKDARRLLLSLLDKAPSIEKTLSRELTSIMTTTRSGKANPKGSTSTSNTPTWTGRYEIHAPALDDWEDSERIVPIIEIYPSSTSAHLWASFEFGIISGIMRSIYPVPSGGNGGMNTDIAFEWRGRESGENQMTIDDSNRAVFTFLEDGRLEGKMQGSFLGTFKVSGLRMPTDFRGNPTPQKSRANQIKDVRNWKYEWRSLNYHNYEVANRARWGKWGGEERNENAFESDTTDGHHKRRTKLNMEKFMREVDAEGPDESDDSGDDEIKNESNLDDDEMEYRDSSWWCEAL